MIEKACLSDVEEILSLINTSNREAYGNIIPKEHFREPVLSLEKLLEDFERMTFCVHKSGDRVVGVAALQIESEETGRIHWVYVLPEHQRRGIGTALVTHLEREGRDIGLRKLRLTTVEKACWAVNFYRKLGYGLVDKIERPWGFDVFMEKELVSPTKNADFKTSTDQTEVHAMSQTWKSVLKADSTDWLLQHAEPLDRFYILREIVERPEDDPETRRLRDSLVSEILGQQLENGSWKDKVYDYEQGTTHQLMKLMELGLTAQDEHVEKGVRYILGFQAENGSFVQGRPGCGVEANLVTTNAAVLALARTGHADDPAVGGFRTSSPSFRWVTSSIIARRPAMNCAPRGRLASSFSPSFGSACSAEPTRWVCPATNTDSQGGNDVVDRSNTRSGTLVQGPVRCPGRSARSRSR